jgi:hypothetical protein
MYLGKRLPEEQYSYVLKGYLFGVPKLENIVSYWKCLIMQSLASEESTAIADVIGLYSCYSIKVTVKPPSSPKLAIY